MLRIEFKAIDGETYHSNNIADLDIEEYTDCSVVKLYSPEGRVASIIPVKSIIWMDIEGEVEEEEEEQSNPTNDSVSATTYNILDNSFGRITF